MVRKWEVNKLSSISNAITLEWRIVPKLLYFSELFMLIKGMLRGNSYVPVDHESRTLLGLDDFEDARANEIK